MIKYTVTIQQSIDLECQQKHCYNFQHFILNVKNLLQIQSRLRIRYLNKHHNQQCYETIKEDFSKAEILLKFKRFCSISGGIPVIPHKRRLTDALEGGVPVPSRTEGTMILHPVRESTERGDLCTNLCYSLYSGATDIAEP